MWPNDISEGFNLDLRGCHRVALGFDNASTHWAIRNQAKILKNMYFFFKFWLLLERVCTVRWQGGSAHYSAFIHLCCSHWPNRFPCALSAWAIKIKLWKKKTDLRIVLLCYTHTWKTSAPQIDTVHLRFKGCGWNSAPCCNCYISRDQKRKYNYNFFFLDMFDMEIMEN